MENSSDALLFSDITKLLDITKNTKVRKKESFSDKSQQMQKPILVKQKRNTSYCYYIYNGILASDIIKKIYKTTPKSSKMMLNKNITDDILKNASDILEKYIYLDKSVKA